MANTSISNLAAGAAVSATDILPNVQTAGVGPVKTTAAELKTFMSASPVFVTPTLGTPISGNFSTGTFTWPTFNQNTTGTAANVTGTVAVANGGTGLTALTANRIPYASGTNTLGTSANLTYDGTTFSVAGNIRATAANIMGYAPGVGVGGSVTQLTSKTTEVTLDKPCGIIVMNNAPLAGGAQVQFVLNNSLVASVDAVILNVNYSGQYQAWVSGFTAGKVYIDVRNITGGSLSDAITLNFAIIKGSNT